jgi:cytochrome c-type biogenesis protein CcmH
MLWLIFAILTLVILAGLLGPLLRRASNEAPPRVDYDIVVYRHQLTEIEQEIERGLLTEAQADAARAEVHRRMLAAEDAELKTPVKPVPADNRHARLAAIVAIAVILPLGAAILYGVLGSPDLIGRPYAWRLNNDPEFVVASTAEKLAALLQNSPSASGYKRLGQMYFASRNYDQAAAADRRAIELGATDAVTWSELGEAVVMTNGGAVVPEALLAFTNSLGINPHGERSRFYLGLAEAQIGNLKQAVAIWRDLEKDSFGAAERTFRRRLECYDHGDDQRDARASGRRRSACAVFEWGTAFQPGRHERAGRTGRTGRAGRAGRAGCGAFGRRRPGHHDPRHGPAARGSLGNDPR